MDVVCGEEGFVDCDGGPAVEQECTVNFDFLDLGLPLDALQPGPFSRAWIDVSIAIESPVHSYYGEVRLRLADDRTFYVPLLTFRADGAYRRYQLPLDEFVDYFDPGTRLTFEAMQGTLDEFHVGARYATGATIHVDQVRILW
jgi:hypothetical protein